MDQLSQELIKNAILVGAEKGANKEFSTKEIARLSGVSEFALFSRFPTKECLIQSSRQYGNEVLVKELEELVPAFEDPVSFSEDAIKRFASHPEVVSYLCNYLTWLWAKDSDPKPKSELRHFGEDGYERVFAKLGYKKEGEARLIAFLSFFRQTLFAANIYVFDKSLRNREGFLLNHAKLLGSGLASFHKEERP
jgi:AcrR family transcriptional regulator